MKNAIFKLGLAFGFIVCCPFISRAQSPGHPMAVPIKMWSVGTQIDTSPLLEIQLTGAIPSTDFPGGVATVSVAPSGTSTTPVGTVQLVPNQVYSVELTATNAAGYYYFAPPNGYTLLVNGVPERSIGPITANNTTINETIDLQLLRIENPSLKAGVSSQIESGMVSWQVSLGGLLNGNSAGYLSICDTGLESTWGSVYTPGALQYMAPSPEVVVYRDPVHGYLSQILGDQADVNINQVNSTEYTISFYNPSQLTGTGYPYGFSGYPFVQYLIQQQGAGNVIEISSQTYETNSSNYMSPPAARTSTTQLTRTGSGVNSYVWSLDNWNTYLEPQVAQETRTWAGVSGSRTESLVVKGLFEPSGSTDSDAITVNKGYTTNSWGEELTAASVGSSNPITNAFSYYLGSNLANPGTYGFLESISSSDGSWVAYNYLSSSTPTNLLGTLTRIYRPFNNVPSSPAGSLSSGEVTTLAWVDDPYGAPTRLWTSVTQVNGTTTSSSSTSYTDNFTSVSIDLPVGNPPTSWTPNTDYVTKAATTVQADSSTSHTLVGTNLFFAENTIDPLVAGQIYSTVGPDGVQQSFAYQRGTFNSSSYTFTAGDTGTVAPASSIAVITGSNSNGAGTLYNLYNGFTINPIYLVNAKSTLQVTIRDPLGLVRSVQSFVWVGGVWQAIGSTNYSYDYAGNLYQTTAPNAGVTTTNFNGQQEASSVDPTGVTLTYSYDYAGRISTIAKTGGSTKNFSYDSAARVTSRWISGTGTSETIARSFTFDDAGRTLTETPPGSSAGVAPIGYAYNYGASGTSSWSRTTTFGDGGTKIEAYQPDGRLASTTGTSVVPQYIAYSLDGTYSGFVDTKVNIGSSGSPRYTVGVTDWLGRSTTITKQGFPGAGALVFTNTYDETTNGTGHLLLTAKSGYANTLYVYDALGAVIESGLDINGNGTLDLNSGDRIASYNSYVWSGSGGYWLRKDMTTYPTAGISSNPLTTSVMQRLTGFSTNQLQETVSLDEYSNNVDRSVTVNAGTQTVTASTTELGFSNAQVITTVNGLETKTTGADSVVTQFGYDKLERQTTVTDPRGNVTTTAFWNDSALAETVADTSPATLATYGYDAAGRRNSTMDASGYTTSLTFNTLGLLSQQTGNGAYPVSYTYDAYGVRQTMTTTWGSGTGTATTTTWNNDPASGLLTSKIDAGGNAVSFTYNADGQVLSRTWPRHINNVSTNALVNTTYAYDTTTGELLTKIYNDGTPTVTYTYARSGQLSTVADNIGTHTYNFDATYGNQVDSETLPSNTNAYTTNFYDGRVLTQLYDGASAVSPTDNYNGVYQTATVLGRPSGFELGISGTPSRDIIQQQVHSNLGQLVGVNATNGTTATRDFVYSYIANTEMISGYSPTSSDSFAVNCAYDSIRPLLTTIQGSAAGSVVTEFDYTYNGKRQRLSSLQRGSAYADYFSGASYTGVYNYYGYDSRGELNTAAMYPGSTVPSGGPGGASMLPCRTFQYQFDALGNRLSAGESGGPDDNVYVPNDLNQYSAVENEVVRVVGNNAMGLTASVTGATTTQLDRNYGADFFPSNSSPNQPAHGSITVTAGSGNVTHSYLIPAATQSVTYDNDGNILTDGMWTYSYDGEDHLIGMYSALPASAGFTRLQLTFTYDYLGRRVEKKSVNIDTSAVTFDHRYIYAGMTLIGETDTSGDLLRSYTWGPGGPGTAGSFIELTNFNYNGSWTLLSTSDYFPSSDGNGNVASLVSSSGVATAAYEYGPFGETMRRETPTSDTTVSDNPIRFASNYTDSETGLVYFGQRYYNPSTGRFINRDPIGENGGVNLYGFCGNDGVNGYDLGGMGPVNGDPNSGLGNLPVWQQNAIRQQMQSDRESPGASPIPGDDDWVTDGSTDSSGDPTQALAAEIPHFGDITDQMNIDGVNYTVIGNPFGTPNGGQTPPAGSIGWYVAVGNGQLTFSAPIQQATGLSFFNPRPVRTGTVTIGDAYEVDDGEDDTDTAAAPGSGSFQQVPNVGVDQGSIYFNQGKSYLFVYNSAEYGPMADATRTVARQAEDFPWSIKIVDIRNIQPGQSWTDFFSSQLGSQRFDGIFWGQHGTPDGSVEPGLAQLFENTLSPLLDGYLSPNGFVVLEQCFGVFPDGYVSAVKNNFGGAPVFTGSGLNGFSESGDSEQSWTAIQMNSGTYAAKEHYYDFQPWKKW